MLETRVCNLATDRQHDDLQVHFDKTVLTSRLQVKLNISVITASTKMQQAPKERVFIEQMVTSRFYPNTSGIFSNVHDGIKAFPQRPRSPNRNKPQPHCARYIRSNTRFINEPFAYMESEDTLSKQRHGAFVCAQINSQSGKIAPRGGKAFLVTEGSHSLEQLKEEKGNVGEDILASPKPGSMNFQQMLCSGTCLSKPDPE
ncbi:uncharacterized protein LOC122552869 [Chiloscyllium plagiosum]|uniref:uncharacterized protein LOC122552869 n=1 Tax=Chiloscyllium plagiosum TaxID=36176 RepID=UPI001CB81D11|nr:uncharacterized protein LOC122552869 [Chiloscyllium plagiosum]